MHLIALYSPAMGSGKTAFAEYLVQQHSFLRLSFAGPLKGMLYHLLASSMGIDGGLAHDMLYGKAKEVPIPGLEPLTPRILAQTIGTDWGRKLDPDFWVKILESRLGLLKNARVVIDDMRFPNEFDLVVKVGGLPVIIVRPGAEVTQAHASEGQLNNHPFKAGVNNNGTLPELYRVADAIVAKMTKPAATANG